MQKKQRTKQNKKRQQLRSVCWNKPTWSDEKKTFFWNVSFVDKQSICSKAKTKEATKVLTNAKQSQQELKLLAQQKQKGDVLFTICCLTFGRENKKKQLAPRVAASNSRKKT